MCSTDTIAQQLNIEYNHFIGADRCLTGPVINNIIIVVNGYTSCSGKGNIPVNMAFINGAIYVTNIDENHNIVWSKVFGGSNEDYSEPIIKTKDNGFVILAVSHSADGDIPHNYGSSDIVLLKFDSSGNKVWIKSY